MKKEKIGFDFDRVFVSYPVFIPSFMIEFLYKNHDKKLSYRFPGKFEQRLRSFTHKSIFRPAIKKNINALKKMFDDEKYEIFLISSRFSFLKSATRAWTKKHKISSYFEKMYFNFDNEQPHLFKNKIIKQEKIKKFIDDDLDLLLFLSKNNPDVEFFWLSGVKTKRKLSSNIKQVKTLEEFRDKFLN